MVTDLLTRFSTKAGYSVYPDVLPFFDMLRKKKTNPDLQSPWRWDETVVGVITNSDDRVPGVLKSLGLSVGPRRVGAISTRSQAAKLEYDVSFVVLSYDVGYEKPHRQIFDAAGAMLNETLAEEEDSAVLTDAADFEMLYVGDDFDKDYFGAQDAGWHAVAVERSLDDVHAPAQNLSIMQRDSGMTREPCADARSRRIAVVNDLRALCNWLPDT
jgi:FMN phosphatase YigB (HAD superfamily)